MALFLIEHGYKAWALKGGIAAWRAAGGRMEPLKEPPQTP